MISRVSAAPPAIGQDLLNLLMQADHAGIGMLAHRVILPADSEAPSPQLIARSNRAITLSSWALHVLYACACWVARARTSKIRPS